MNLKLNMNDINKMLANAHFKCKCYQKNDVKKQHIFVETCLYKAVGNLSVMPGLCKYCKMFYHKNKIIVNQPGLSGLGFWK
jgi:hypothetical protein